MQTVKNSVISMFRQLYAVDFTTKGAHYLFISEIVLKNKKTNYCYNSNENVSKMLMHNI